MAEPLGRSGPLQIQIDYAFDRLCDSKLAQAYSILVPCRERPMGGHVKEFEHEDGSHLCPGLVRAATRVKHDRESDSVVYPVRSGRGSGGAQRMGLRR